MTKTERSKLQAYLARPLDDLMAELELYDPASRDPAEAWNKVAGPVRQRLCVEWGWCEVRQDQRWDDDLSRRMNSLLKLKRPLSYNELTSGVYWVYLGCKCSRNKERGQRDEQTGPRH
jgi:hypothetical protein